MRDITGLMVYYYFVCKRKLWYFCNNLTMEQNSELVKIGTTIDEGTYTNMRKQILIDNTINIDFIKNKVVLHEVKKSKAIEEAGIWQLKYYMYYLEKRGVKDIKAKIDFPILRKTEEIILQKKDKEYLEDIIEDIQNIISSSKPEETINKKICEKCSYHDICYI
ncbi:MAG: CRISPR-associated protein Cas4 [Clostridia bacterium]